MIDLDKIFNFPLDSDLASKTMVSSHVNDGDLERRDTFKGILENRLRGEIPAKNGKESPSHEIKDMDKQYRSLEGGTELVLVGNEPSNESVQEFAVLQGIDPETMALIIDSSEAMAISTGINEVTEFMSVGPGHRVMKDRETQSSPFQTVNDSKINKLSPIGKNFVSVGELSLFSEVTPQDVRQEILKSREIQLSSLQPLSDPKMNKLSSVETNFATVDKLRISDGIKDIGTAQMADLASSFKISPQGDPKKAIVSSNNQNKKLTLSNLKVETTLGNLNNVFSRPAAQKLKMISLGDGIEEALSQLKTQGTSPQTLNIQSFLRGDNSGVLTSNLVNDIRSDLSSKSGVEPETNIDHEQFLRRQEQYLDASRRLASALGERLTAQISRGAWRVEMDLHPKSLGRIEIQLEMRNGDLEAYFNPSQNITRDLLVESFSKLRDVLSEHGIDSAYIGLGSGEKHGSDGKSTDSIVIAEKDKDESEFDSKNSEVYSPDQTITSDGLDIKV